ncbi:MULTISPECIES: hypothetical protein [Xanthomonas]|uniref:hypothetical protein n=1 Tax=Xanthomonas TaxID=338 RepID=UPI000CEEB41F|nr:MULTISPECIES: hypothetical protein [Xanthomonas]MCD0274299.1 hypothetical protein [Xanthomonas campestris pv. campestris]MCF8788327.1 hypothetical protein [Xanthomonas campestris pv. campestris]MCF8802366.1 hypothetical protein [Xanthomonas campestris pv. campestris]MCF8804480.1 hypothetical protein [Xanthomonas campestris pv. campestris]MCF8816516.1 hypothetical protein [Xanthomonas campestris]
MNTITDAFDDFSHSLRVLQEADFRAASGLLVVDRAEAVGNIENAWSSVLNAFHSLYDAMEKDPGYSLDWYAKPELALILVLRNARHHNHARKVRTLYAHYVQEAEKIGRLEMYLLLDFPAGEEGGDTFDLYLSWEDFNELLALPQGKTRIRPVIAQAIREYLGTASFNSYAVRYDLAENRVVFNAIPLICNAAATLVPIIEKSIKSTSTEAGAFLVLFKDMPQSLMHEPEISVGPIAYMP